MESSSSRRHTNTQCVSLSLPSAPSQRHTVLSFNWTMNTHTHSHTHTHSQDGRRLSSLLPNASHRHPLPLRPVRWDTNCWRHDASGWNVPKVYLYSSTPLQFKSVVLVLCLIFSCYIHHISEGSTVLFTALHSVLWLHTLRFSHTKGTKVKTKDVMRESHLKSFFMQNPLFTLWALRHCDATSLFTVMFSSAWY